MNITVRWSTQNIHEQSSESGKEDLILYKIIKNYKEKCEYRRQEIEQLLSAMPDGTLHISKSGNYYTWRVSTGNGNRKYLPKKERDLAGILALKKFYEAQMHDLKNDIEACRRFLHYKDTSVDETALLMNSSSAEYKNLLGAAYANIDEKITEWENLPYEKSSMYPENLIHRTFKEGEKVRSKLEASVAGSLYTLKIPYKYEKMTMIGNNKFAVDFTALDVRTFREIPIEVFGMMSDYEYVKNFKRKMTIYINSGYIPGINMMTFYESRETPLELEYVNQELERFFFQNPPVQFQYNEY